MYGDTAVMRRRVDQLREQADEVRSRARTLVAQAEGVPWTGRAAETMRARVRDRAARLREAAGLHDDAAEALERHVTEVDRLQEAIAAAELRARSRSEEPDGTDEQDPRTTPHARTTGPTGPTGPTDEDQPPPGHRDWLTWAER